jgi:putative intracellular protease/amidase
MKQYLENPLIRDKLVPYFNNEDKIVGAVCHGTIVLARAIDPSTGKSLLYQRKSTTLPKYMERLVSCIILVSIKILF